MKYNIKYLISAYNLYNYIPLSYISLSYNDSFTLDNYDIKDDNVEIIINDNRIINLNGFFIFIKLYEHEYFAFSENDMNDLKSYSSSLYKKFFWDFKDVKLIKNVIIQNIIEEIIE